MGAVKKIVEKEATFARFLGLARKAAKAGEQPKPGNRTRKVLP
jgi:hypothetical protein